METATATRPLEAFTAVRALLYSIAYRMLVSAMEAEDVVQEAYLRWREASDTDVRSHRAYLVTIVTRLSINQLRSARVQRETYVGPWLPEPVVTEHVPEVSWRVELAESLSMAFLYCSNVCRRSSARCSCYTMRSSSNTPRSLA